MDTEVIKKLGIKEKRDGKKWKWKDERQAGKRRRVKECDEV